MWPRRLRVRAPLVTLLALVAQSEEQPPCKRSVVGSNPSEGLRDYPRPIQPLDTITSRVVPGGLFLCQFPEEIGSDVTASTRVLPSNCPKQTLVWYNSTWWAYQKPK